MLKWSMCAAMATMNRTEFTVRRPVLAAGDVLVVKVGSSQLTSNTAGLNRDRIQSFADSIAALVQAQIRVVLVSSGAVAEGVFRLGLPGRPKRIHRLQAAAAVGQTGLVRAYEDAFAGHQIPTALVLLTHADLVSRERYLNASSTLTTLLDLGVVPIVNENDTVATEEIRFGDNDTLGALVANLLRARLLLMLTDQDGLHEADPRTNPSAPLLTDVAVGAPELEKFCGASSGELGRGGMLTKIRAARQAARSGTFSIIANGARPGIVQAAAAGQAVGTAFHPDENPLAARKRWLSGQLRTAGQLIIDAGAERALSKDGSSLLPVGVQAVAGDFSRGDLVSICATDGRELGRGLVNYSSEEAAALKGQASAAIAQTLGYCNERELVHRDNLVLLTPARPL